MSTKPTRKHLRHTRERGVVPRSPMANAALAILTVASVVGLAASAAWGWFSALARDALSIGSDPSVESAQSLLSAGVDTLSWALFPVLGALVLAVAVGVLVQVGPGWTPGALVPRLERLAPRFVGTKSGRRAADGLLRGLFGVALALAASAGVWGTLHAAARVERLGLEHLRGPLVDVFWAVLAIVGVFAAVDVALRRSRWREDVSMSRADRRREAREQGAGSVAKRRRRRGRPGRAADLTGEAEATHWISDGAGLVVGLCFDRESAATPRVVAGGRGAAAEVVLSSARSRGVPVFIDVDLARVLSPLPAGVPIPEGLFEAVARLMRAGG